MIKPATLLAALALSACSSLPPYESAPDLTFASYVSVKGDALDGQRTANSQRARPLGYSDGRVTSYVYALAARTDAGAGAAWIVFKTRSADWLYPTALNFGSPLRSISGEREDSNVSCSAGGCTHTETTTFELTPADVRQLLAGPEVIELRLKSRADTDRTIRKAEIRATLDAVGVLGEFE